MVVAFALVAGCDSPTATRTDSVCLDPPAIDAQEATELYVAAWSEEDPVERGCMFRRSLAGDAVLIASSGPVEGRSAVATELEERAAFLLDESGSRDAAGSIASRHEEALLPWVLTDASGAMLERGEDWVEFGDDGLLSRIHVLEGTGDDAPPNEALLAWERAWNTRDETSRADALDSAATEDVRFTDVLTDIQGRDALGAEIGRQHEVIDAQLRLGERVEVLARVGDEPTVIRLPARIVVPQGGDIHVVDYVRLRDGRIERLSGFPTSAP